MTQDPKKKSARPTTRAGSAKAKGDDKDDKKKLTPKPPAGAPGKKAETQARPTIKTPEDPKLKKTGPVDKLKKDPKNASIKPKKGKLDDSKDDAEDVIYSSCRIWIRMLNRCSMSMANSIFLAIEVSIALICAPTTFQKLVFVIC